MLILIIRSHVTPKLRRGEKGMFGREYEGSFQNSHYSIPQIIYLTKMY